MAIIVAGGINRLPMIYDLIRSLQSAIPQTSPPPWPLKRARVTYDQLYAGQPVDEVEDVSVESFITAKSSKPFIVRNFASGASSCPPWRAIDRWSSGDYLLRTAGPGRMVPVELGRAYDEEGWSQQIMPFEDFLHRAGYFDDVGEPVYLAQHSLFRQIPELEKDISMPDIIWSQPSTQHLDYQPPEEPQLNVWVGNAGKIVSPPHTVSLQPAWLMTGSLLQLLCPGGRTQTRLASTTRLRNAGVQRQRGRLGNRQGVYEQYLASANTQTSS